MTCTVDHASQGDGIDARSHLGLGMVRYRRNHVPGASYFFTLALHDRRRHWLTDHIGPLREAYQHTQVALPFETVAIVILPEHLHAIWTLPDGDHDYPGRWRGIKSRFTHALLKAGCVHAQTSRMRSPVWQSRYWEHTLRDEFDLQNHIDYIHYNPVKHGWVQRARDWPHSSFHRFVARGDLPIDWGGEARSSADHGYGE